MNIYGSEAYLETMDKDQIYLKYLCLGHLNEQIYISYKSFYHTSLSYTAFVFLVVFGQWASTTKRDQFLESTGLGKKRFVVSMRRAYSLPDQSETLVQNIERSYLMKLSGPSYKVQKD